MINRNPYQEFTPSAEDILNGLADSILVVNKERVIVYANAAAEALFQISLHRLIGSYFSYSLATSHPSEVAIQSYNSVRTIQIVNSRIQRNDEQLYLVSLRDISGLAGRQKKLEKANDLLETANAELMQHASLTSHDLKEPVRKIQIFADRLLQKDGELDEHTKSQIRRISQSADRLKSLISAINEFSSSSNQQKDYQKLDLNLVVEEVLKDLDLAIYERNAEIEVERLPEVDGIPSQMHRLFLNLILNAIKYSKPNTRPKVWVHAKVHKKFVVVTVKDNGIGISEQFAEKVFQPFIRLHAKNVEGSGIGLAICKKIVESHGGAISVSSKEGEGSCFLFSLRRCF